MCVQFLADLKHVKNQFYLKYPSCLDSMMELEPLFFSITKFIFRVKICCFFYSYFWQHRFVIYEFTFVNWSQDQNTVFSVLQKKAQEGVGA